MRHFTLEMLFKKINYNKTVYCWYAQTKLKKDIIQSWGNSPAEAIQELFDAVDFERGL